MKLILKPIFEILTGDIVVCDNLLANYILLLIVGEIAYRLSFKLVRVAYQSSVIHGKAIGSLLHWGLRIPFYIVTAYLIYGVIKLYEFIAAIPLWLIWTILGIAVIILSFLLLLAKRSRKTEAICAESLQQATTHR